MADEKNQGMTGSSGTVYLVVKTIRMAEAGGSCASEVENDVVGMIYILGSCKYRCRSGKARHMIKF